MELDLTVRSNFQILSKNSGLTLLWSNMCSESENIMWGAYAMYARSPSPSQRPKPSRQTNTESPEKQRIYEDRMKMFRIWFTNVDTVTLDKNLELKRLIDSTPNPPDLIALSEAKPKKSLLDWNRGFRTFRQKTFWQKHGGGPFGKKNMPKRLRLKTFAETFLMICGAYPVYANSPSPSQRPAPSTIASRSPFPLGLRTCSTSLSTMGI